MSSLMEQIRCDIDKLERRGLANLTDVQLLANLLLIESHLTEREEKSLEMQRKNTDTQSNSAGPSAKEEESLSVNGQFDQNINRLYKSYMKKRESCLTRMDEDSKNIMSRALGLLLGELHDLLSTLYSSAIYQDEREMIKAFIENLKDLQ